MSIISVSNVAVEFGATTLLSDVTFTVGEGEKWGIVGRNGTGKTTLFRLISGTQKASTGTVARSPSATISILDQHRALDGADTVWEAAAAPFRPLVELEASLTEQAVRIGELGEAVTEQVLNRYSADLERFERDGGYTYSSRVDAVLQGLGFDPQAARTQSLEFLSGGERGRVGLAQQLVAPADILLLDEPTNHLDLETTAWLEEYLLSTTQTIILISHDRAFLASVVDHVLHIEGGTTAAYAASYEQFIAQREERRLSQQRAFTKQARVIANEEDYIRRNIAGNNSRQAKGRRKRLERVARLSPPLGEAGSMALKLDVQDRGGDQVVVARDVNIEIGDRKLITGLTGVVKRGDRLGIVGPNGAGKSTFLKTLMGERAPASGHLALGNSIDVEYYRQDLAQVPREKSLYDIISDLRPSWERGLIYGHLGRFGFSGEETSRIAGTLSGGERARIALAMMMLSRSNLLVFDEPTNHLDVESIEALEDAIEAYGGTVILVSHDRALLRALCNRVWTIEGQRVSDFDGSFAEWEVVAQDKLEQSRKEAQEAQADRREREKRKSQRETQRVDTDRNEIRALQRRVAEAERMAVLAEAEVAKITALLNDPGLYNTPEGIAKSVELGKDNEEAKARLQVALETWEQLSGQLEAIEKS